MFGADSNQDFLSSRQRLQSRVCEFVVNLGTHKSYLLLNFRRGKQIVDNLDHTIIEVSSRVGELPDSTMKAIEIGHVRRVVCASPAYLKANGTPRVPSDLSDCSVIAASPVSASVDWQFKSGKKTIGIKVRPRLTVTNNEAAIVAAVEGFGVARLLSYQIAPYLVSGQLNVVLADYEPTRLPIHILHLESRNVSGKVRTFVDLLVEQLRNNVALR